MTAPSADTDPRRWRVLVLLAIAELLGMSLWFGASAVATELGARWSLDTSQVGWMTSVVQLGFVIGTALAALLNIADIVPARWFFAASAFAGGLANLGLLAVTSYGAVLVLRFATGLFLAGVYPPAMKMASTWFRAQRGLAIGTVVGALVIGKSTPYLIHALPHTSPAVVVTVASVSAFISAILIASAYHDGPYAFPARPFSFGLVGAVWSSREWRLATGGYLGHMFELYSFWTWVSAFTAASLVASGFNQPALVSLIAFLAIAAGGVGSVWGGLAADRRGREWLVTVSMIASGSCALLSPLVFGHGRVLLIGLALVWGYFVVSDSAQFSALVTESVPAHAVGTALTLQTSAGFLLTMISIQLIPPIVRSASWQWAFPMLALGPAAGVLSIRALVRFRQRIA
jgi:MFS family permease